MTAGHEEPESLVKPCATIMSASGSSGTNERTIMPNDSPTMSELDFYGDRFPLFLVRIYNHNGRVRHQMMFSDRGVATRCALSMRQYYTDKRPRNPPYVHFNTTLWLRYGDELYFENDSFNLRKTLQYAQQMNSTFTVAHELIPQLVGERSPTTCCPFFARLKRLPEPASTNYSFQSADDFREIIDDM